MGKKVIVALDQGTTSSRAVLFDQDAGIVGVKSKELRQYYPKPGWVEHDAVEIWEDQLGVLKEAIAGRGSNRKKSRPLGSPTREKRSWYGTGGPASRSAKPSCGNAAGLRKYAAN